MPQKMYFPSSKQCIYHKKEDIYKNKTSNEKGTNIFLFEYL